MALVGRKGAKQFDGPHKIIVAKSLVGEAYLLEEVEEGGWEGGGGR